MFQAGQTQRGSSHLIVTYFDPDLFSLVIKDLGYALCLNGQGVKLKDFD